MGYVAPKETEGEKMRDYQASVTTTIPVSIADWLDKQADALNISRASLIRELIVKGCNSMDSTLPESITNVLNVVAAVNKAQKKGKR